MVKHTFSYDKIKKENDESVSKVSIGVIAHYGNFKKQ
jgi:hypothetical protein